ncbi:MAG: hypothetical protein PHN88_13790 [Ignavibacteria bacterium]|nr:hypothetical protein [Ignavibacteria bacterium]
MKKIILLFFVVFLYTNSNAQLFNKFSIAAGPVFGWNVPSFTDLNNELKKAGMDEFSKSGVFATGGGGFIDIPVIKGLRLGGYGYGFSTSKTTTLISNSKVADFSYSAGLLSIEYSRKLGKRFDWTVGAMVGIGSTNLKLSNFTNSLKEWNINNYLGDTISSGSTASIKSTSYSFIPQAGIGFQATKFLYFKLNAGYLLTVNSKWKLDDIIELNNFPTGIKSDGLMFNLGIYLGLFVD